MEMNEDRQCRVCGGGAYGYNFNRICCESCKAFVRRSTLRDQVRPTNERERCLLR